MKKNTTAVVAIMIALIALVGTGLSFAFTAATSASCLPSRWASRSAR